LSRRLYDAHYLWVKDNDFVERAELFEKALADEDAFFGGRLVRLPQTPFMFMLLEDGETPLADFLAYYWFHHHEERTKSLQVALSAGDASEGQKHLDRHLGELDVIATEQKQRIVFSRAIIQAEIDALTDIRRADESRYQALVDRIATEQAASAKPVKEPEHATGPLLSVAARGWIAEKSSTDPSQRQRRSWSLKRKATCEATLALCIAIVGDKPIDSYRKADARDFKQVLSDLPPNRSKLKEIRDLDVREAAKRARELDLPKMSVVNINKQITIISSLFDWLWRQGRLKGGKLCVGQVSVGLPNNRLVEPLRALSGARHVSRVNAQRAHGFHLLVGPTHDLEMGSKGLEYQFVNITPSHRGIPTQGRSLRQVLRLIRVDSANNETFLAVSLSCLDLTETVRFRDRKWQCTDMRGSLRLTRTWASRKRRCAAPAVPSYEPRRFRARRLTAAPNFKPCWPSSVPATR
jgi:hypothetical protein